MRHARTVGTASTVVATTFGALLVAAVPASAAAPPAAVRDAAVAAPTIAVSAVAPISEPFRAVTLSVVATAPAGLRGLVVREARSDAAGRFTGWGPEYQRPASTTQIVWSPKYARSTCLSVQAVDVDGRRSPQVVRCTSVPRQFSATLRAQREGWTGGAPVRTRRQGASLPLKFTPGSYTSIAYVAGPGRGTFGLFVQGRLVGKVRTASSVVEARTAEIRMPRRSGSRAELRVLSSGKLVAPRTYISPSLLAGSEAGGRVFVPSWKGFRAPRFTRVTVTCQRLIPLPGDTGDPQWRIGIDYRTRGGNWISHHDRRRYRPSSTDGPYLDLVVDVRRPTAPTTATVTLRAVALPMNWRTDTTTGYTRTVTSVRTLTLPACT